MMIILSWASTLFLTRILERSWWGPAALLALILGGSAVATSIFAPEYYMSLAANMLLQLFVFMVLLGSMVSRLLPEHPNPSSLELKVSSKRGFLTFGLASSLVLLYAVMSSLGVSIQTLLNPSRFLTLAQTATRQRYLEGVEIPLYGNIASACVLAYVAVLVMHVTTTRKFSVPMLVPVAIFGLSNAVLTTRSTIVYLLITSLLAYAYAYSQSSASRSFPGIFKKKTLLLMALIALLLIGIFVGFQIMRFGQSGARPIGEVFDYLRRWPWGSLPGFSLWWDGMAPGEGPHIPGYYTFMGIFDNLGIEPRTPGGYSGYVMLTADEPGNIYTAFRGLVEDFGVGGASVFLFGLGLIGGAAQSGRLFPGGIRIAVFFLIYMWIATSFIVSQWAFVGNVLAAVLVPIVLRAFAGARMLATRS